MKIVFRADASTAVGSGHVMRCLTLADALQRRGAACHFVSREEPGHLMELVQQRGHAVHALAAGGAGGCNSDAEQSRPVLAQLRPDWLIADHYRLGREWEIAIAALVRNVLVIDDIGRSHECDLLLDQNFRNPNHARYADYVPARCELLLGPQFALVRPEFAELRPRALGRRDGSVGRLLVSMGGSDAADETSKALAGVSASRAANWRIDVVIGASNPNRPSVEAACARLPAAAVHVQTAQMAQLMLDADCAIGAGGSTAWERCCLGLPALVAVTSPDQEAIATALAEAGAHMLLGCSEDLSSGDYAAALDRLSAAGLRAMSQSAAGICDGHGAERVADKLSTSRDNHA